MRPAQRVIKTKKERGGRLDCDPRSRGDKVMAVGAAADSSGSARDRGDLVIFAIVAMRTRMTTTTTTTKRCPTRNKRKAAVDKQGRGGGAGCFGFGLGLGHHRGHCSLSAKPPASASASASPLTSAPFFLSSLPPFLS